MIPQQYHDDDIHHLLRLAFGRPIRATPVPVVAGSRTRGVAFALHDQGVPEQVLLLRYSPQHQRAAFRTFNVLRSLHAHAFPVPRVHFMGWSAHLHYVVLLVEQIAGRGVEGQPRAFFGRVGPQFAATLAHLHQLAWQPMPDLAATPFHYAFRELTAMVRQLETPQLVQILAWLLQRAGQIVELPHTVIHGDYTLHNVVADQTRIVAVYGWDNAVIADPRFDVGYTSAALGAIDPTLADQFIYHYSAVAGPVPELRFWEVFSALRLLTRVARTISTLQSTQRARFLEQVQEQWNCLLDFVELRTGMMIQ